MSASDITIVRGSTFSQVMRWSADPVVYKPISAVVSLAPLRLTVTAHGLPDGWPVAISDIVGMVEANAKHAPPRRGDYVKAKVVDANTLEFNGINATGFTPYVSGGNIQYKTPVDLTGYSANLEFRAYPDLTLPALFMMSTANARIVLDNTAKTITLTALAADTIPLVLTNATFDLEMTSAAGVKTKIRSGFGNTVNESTS